ncbi:MAG: peptidylprolyl isomerase [Anaerolineae bacterium]|nr:peptidylprolyl isomerase [Anaerolineae bacterium]
MKLIKKPMLVINIRKRMPMWVWGIGLCLAVVACTGPTFPPVTQSPAKTTASTAAVPKAQVDDNTPVMPTLTPTPNPPTPTVTPEPLAAQVNDTLILLAEYERQVALYEASMRAAGQDPNTPEGQSALNEARGWVLDRMIEQVLIEQAAIQAGVTTSEEEVDVTIQSLIDEIGTEAFEERLKNEGMSLDELRVELRREMIATQMANKIASDIPQSGEHIHARHILLNTEEEAQQILAQLQAGADFVSLAQQYSQDASTRDLGGDLGYFPMGILTSPEVESAAFALQPGQISEVIPSALGYHILQVIERVPDSSISPENMRLLQDKAVRTWLEDLWATAEVQRFISTP